MRQKKYIFSRHGFVPVFFLVLMALSAPLQAQLTVTGGTEGTDYKFETYTPRQTPLNVLTILTSTPLTISGSTTNVGIRLKSGITANVTLSNVRIELPGNENNTEAENASYEFACAFDVVQNSTANITLSGTNNYLKSGPLAAGIQVGQNATVNISGSNSDKITIQGGMGAAGIGGGQEGYVGTINITGGDITTTGGFIYMYKSGEYYIVVGYGGGAGIGGGANQKSAPVITITGTGPVQAIGQYGAAAIGGGAYTSIAVSRYKTPQPQSNRGDAGTIVILNDNVKTSIEERLNNMTDIFGNVLMETIGHGAGAASASSGNQIVMIGSTNYVKGSPSLPFDIEIPSGKEVTVENAAKLTIPTNKTLTNKGVIFNNGQIVCSNGTFNNTNGLVVAMTGSSISSCGSYGGQNLIMIEDSWFSIEDTVVLSTSSTAFAVYTGLPSTPIIKNTKNLTSPTDYTVSCTDVNVGNATVTITGTGRYYGTVTKSFKIYPAMLTITDAEVTPKTYDGNTSATVTGITLSGLQNGETLALGTDYTISGMNYSDNANAGTNHTVYIRVVLNSESDKAKNYMFFTTKSLCLSPCEKWDTWYYTYFYFTTAATKVINPKSISGADVTISGNYTYTGSAQTPEQSLVVVSMDAPYNTLTYNTDYTYEVTGGGTDAGTATLTVTGKGNYTGTATQTFTINKAVLTVTDGTVTAKDYDGNTSATVTELAFDGLQNGNLTPGQDYTVTNATYNDANAGNSHTVSGTVTMLNNNYTLSSTSFTTANDKVINKAALTVTDGTVTPKDYDASTSATVTGFTFSGLQNGETLALGTDYTIGTNPSPAYNNANAGNSHTVSGTVSLLSTAKANNYTLASSSFTTAASKVINPKSISGAGVTISGNYTYTGLKQTPEQSSVVVSMGAPYNTLTYNTDYTYAVTGGGTDAGTATLTVTGKGNYTGTATQTFTINKVVLTVTDGTVTAKDYDGNTSATITGLTFSGLQNGETLALGTDYTIGTNPSPAYDDPNAGTTHTVSGTVSLLSTGKANNYRLSSNSFTTANDKVINKAALTVTDGTVTPKDYDGNTSATVTGLEFDGLQNGETLALGTDYEVESPVYDNPNAGTTHTVSGTVSLLSTGKANNYVLSSTSFTTLADKIIYKAALTVTDGTVTPKDYDGNTSATVTELEFDGLQNGETLALGTDYTIGTNPSPAYDNPNAGNSHTVSGTVSLLSTGKANNYRLSSNSFTTVDNKVILPGSLNNRIAFAPSVIMPQKYTGSPVLPSVVLTDKLLSLDLVLGTDYDTTAVRNVRVCDGATLAFAGKGNYTGTATLPFLIQYPCGENDPFYNTASQHVKDTTVIVTDIDGNTYPTVRLGCDCWITKNLAVQNYANGDAAENTIYRSALYPDVDANLAAFGRLYTYAAATLDGMSAQGICPAGWRLPTVSEWQALNLYGAADLKITGTGYWMNEAVANGLGLSLVPGGYYDGNTNSCYHLLGDAWYWAYDSGVNTTTITPACHFTFGCPEAIIQSQNKANGASVRCLKAE
ncbi:MAG: YDG domain-containing protein [Bacteroidales bacterium]|jgi:uncharacterized protein (TIGR02145 family)|nr:YDG domain-containing protein [Bacteroidales bacterium]